MTYFNFICVLMFYNSHLILCTLLGPIHNYNSIIFVLFPINIPEKITFFFLSGWWLHITYLVGWITETYKINVYTYASTICSNQIKLYFIFMYTLIMYTISQKITFFHNIYIAILLVDSLHNNQSKKKEEKSWKYLFCYVGVFHRICVCEKWINADFLYTNFDW